MVNNKATIIGFELPYQLQSKLQRSQWIRSPENNENLKYLIITLGILLKIYNSKNRFQY